MLAALCAGAGSSGCESSDANDPNDSSEAYDPSESSDEADPSKPNELFAVAVAPVTTKVYTACAKEGGTCAFSGTKVIRYGDEGHYIYKTFTNGTPCRNDVMGSDPHVGVVKACAIESDSTAIPASTMTVLSPATGSTVSGVVQIKGQAGSQWKNVVAYDASGAKVAADVTPANGTFTLSLDTSKLAKGTAKISVVAFSVGAGQPGGTNVSVVLNLTISSSTPVQTTAPVTTAPVTPPPVTYTPVTGCALTSPSDGADVRGIVSLRASAKGSLASVSFYLSSGQLIATSSTRDGNDIVASWNTLTVGGEGKAQVYAVCTDTAGTASAKTAPLSYWVSNTRGSMMGLNGPLSKAQVDDQADQLHVRWIRSGIDLAWVQYDEAAYNRDVASANGGMWPSVKPFSDQIAYAHAKNIRVLAVVEGTPAWMRGRDRTDGGGNVWKQAILPSRRDEFAEYAKQICLAGADAIEITNEPNFRAQYFMGPDHPRAAYPDERIDDFVMLVRAVYTHVKADARTRNCQVGLPGPANVGHEQHPTADAVAPVTWYHRLFNAKADDRVTPVSVAGYFDFAAAHPYADAASVSSPLDWASQWYPQYGDAAYWQGIATVGRIRAEVVAGGGSATKIWATELGVATFGGNCLTRADRCVSPAQQATWVGDYVKAWMTSGATGFSSPLASNCYGNFSGPMIYYQWKDTGDGVTGPKDKEGFFGIEQYNGTHKPAFDAMKAQALLLRP